MSFPSVIVKTIVPAIASLWLYSSAHAAEVQYKQVVVDGMKIFYREAGDASKPTILLLHGFPSSSTMFRTLIPLLSEKYHLVAPDYPGMGNSEAPPADKFHATFDSVATVIQHFTAQIGTDHFILYMQDFGGPIGMRIAVREPEAVDGVIIQNTPISLDGWDPARLKAIQANTGPVTPEKRAAAEARVSNATSLLLHQKGAANPENLDPDNWAVDALALSDPEKRRVMTDLQLDIPSNFAVYPEWQRYLQTKQPSTLVVWGKNDPIFAVRGAQAVKDSNPKAVVRLYDTGHFALDEDGPQIASEIEKHFGQ